MLPLGVTGVLGAQLVALRGYSPQRLAADGSNMPNPDPALVFPEGRATELATEAHGVVGVIARPMFESYLVPFEITSVLLLAAVVGAVVLAKKRI